jgi:hypothetical protein
MSSFPIHSGSDFDTLLAMIKLNGKDAFTAESTEVGGMLGIKPTAAAKRLQRLRDKFFPRGINAEGEILSSSSEALLDTSITLFRPRFTPFLLSTTILAHTLLHNTYSTVRTPPNYNRLSRAISFHTKNTRCLLLLRLLLSNKLISIFSLLSVRCLAMSIPRSSERS